MDPSSSTVPGISARIDFTFADPSGSDAADAGQVTDPPKKVYKNVEDGSRAPR